MTFKIREICENSWLNFKHTKSFNKFEKKKAAETSGFQGKVSGGE